MPTEEFWRERFRRLGARSVGPGDAESEADADLEQHRATFLTGISSVLASLKGPVLDFGCGTGRWTADLPRPYIGLDLLPEHLEICRKRHGGESGVEFRLSSELSRLPARSFGAIFTCTVLQHVVEPDQRRFILKQFERILAPDGVFLSVEWAAGQRQFDWCSAVGRHDYTRHFNAYLHGDVVHLGRHHHVWICRKKEPRHGPWGLYGFARRVLDAVRRVSPICRRPT